MDDTSDYFGTCLFAYMTEKRAKCFERWTLCWFIIWWIFFLLSKFFKFEFCGFGPQELYGIIKLNGYWMSLSPSPSFCHSLPISLSLSETNLKGKRKNPISEVLTIRIELASLIYPYFVTRSWKAKAWSIPSWFEMCLLMPALLPLRAHIAYRKNLIWYLDSIFFFFNWISEGEERTCTEYSHSTATFSTCWWT